MSLTFLRSDVLHAVHARLIVRYGGLSGVRSSDALESAVARPHSIHHYAGENRVAVLAASLAWALLRNHPFIDGNKRVALGALVMLADLNGYTLACDEAEETLMVLKAAGGEISEAEWVRWALAAVVPR